jgi:uncharacterized protein
LNQVDKSLTGLILARYFRFGVEEIVKFRVAEISQEGQRFEFPVELLWLEEVLSGDLPSSFSPLEKSLVQGKIQRIESDVIIQARCDLRLQSVCSNCLSPFELGLVHVSFDMSLKPKPRISVKVPMDLELATEELNQACYEDDLIDFDSYLREQIILALPMFPRCQEECKGLCGECGANLNTNKCRCQKQSTDPRWAALQSLKIQ